MRTPNHRPALDAASPFCLRSRGHMRRASEPGQQPMANHPRSVKYRRAPKKTNFLSVNSGGTASPILIAP